MQAPQTHIPVHEVEQHVADSLEISKTDPEVAELQKKIEDILSHITQLEKSRKLAKSEALEAHVSYQKWKDSLSKVLSDEPFYSEAVAKADKHVSDLKTAIKEAYAKSEEYSSAWSLLEQAFMVEFLSKTLGGTKFRKVNVLDPSDKKGKKRMTVYVLVE